ncbi:MAG: chemotaxis protein CheA [Candidatus Eremiobacteraeota bacterium]|nr:chemotaxis protein CheA [Candidatus Eremiobacteraeota bacterium]
MALPLDSDPEMLSDFLVEAWEQVEILDREFVALEEEPDNLERITTIFRVMHTLKGGAGFLGLEMMECLTHYAETLLSRMREGELAVTRERSTVLLKTADACKSILQYLEKESGEGPVRYNDLMVELKREAENRNQDTAPSVASELRPKHQGMSDLEDFQAQLLAAMSGEAEREEEEATPAPVTEIAVAQANPAEMPGPVGEEEQVSGSHTCDSRIRVQVDLLDKLMNLVGELVLSRNQILQISTGLESTALSSACQRINLVTSELQVHVMQTRMQPVSTLLNRFPRIIRDLCAQTGKEAKFTMDGQDTGLDRTILEAVKDPLTHILRNSVDHGLEAPQVRTSRGKSARGHIHIRAYHEGGQVTIEINDDGAGVNLERVKEKAVSQGLVTSQEAQRMCERDALQLLFQPGFSTAATVTNLSGRGVGMDVVRTSVEKIGGSVDLSTVPGQGTQVKLRLPLTLAIIPALLVSSNGQRYAIPQVNLQELVRLEGAEAQAGIERIYGAEVYRLRGQLLPLLRLRSVLGSPVEASDTVNIVVVNADGTPFGLIVDGVCDTEEIVVKPLTRELKQLQLYAGATIMGDGTVALILDVAGLGRTSKLHQEKSKDRDKEENEAQTDPSCQSLLLFRLSGNEQFAIPLTLLSRLEEFHSNQVEMVRGEQVVQYRGRLLKLVDMAGHFGMMGHHGSETYRVLVFNYEGTDLGLVVEEILDVVDDTLVLEPGSSGRGVMGTAVIAGKATTVVDLLQLVGGSQSSFAFH